MADISEPMYYVNLYSARYGTIHEEGCPHEHFDPTNPSNWLGKYATRGAAIDAVLALGRRPWESRCCIKNRTNDED